jgi:hypothetical protein
MNGPFVIAAPTAPASGSREAAVGPIPPAPGTRETGAAPTSPRRGPRGGRARGGAPLSRRALVAGSLLAGLASPIVGAGSTFNQIPVVGGILAEETDPLYAAGQPSAPPQSNRLPNRSAVVSEARAVPLAAPARGRLPQDSGHPSASPWKPATVSAPCST